MEIGEIAFLILVLLIVYIYVATKWSNHKKRKLREETVPILENTITAKEKYNVFLSDGRTL